MSTRRFGTDHPTAMRIPAALFALIATVIAVPLIPTAVGAQAYERSGGAVYGMTGRGGMMGGWGSQARQQLTLAQSMRLLDQSAAHSRIDKAHNRVIFTGTRVFVAMAAVQPGFPDTTFEVAGLVDPTIEVPAGATVTLLLINMDYGPDMDHGVVITEVPPPYRVMSMMGIGRAVTGIPVLQPRDGESATSAHYAAESVTFTAPGSSGAYYYLCQYYDHASKGMFGRFEVR